MAEDPCCGDSKPRYVKRDIEARRWSVDNNDLQIEEMKLKNAEVNSRWDAQINSLQEQYNAKSKEISSLKDGGSAALWNERSAIQSRLTEARMNRNNTMSNQNQSMFALQRNPKEPRDTATQEQVDQLKPSYDKIRDELKAQWKKEIDKFVAKWFTQFIDTFDNTFLAWQQECKDQLDKVTNPSVRRHAEKRYQEIAKIRTEAYTEARDRAGHERRLMETFSARELFHGYNDLAGRNLDAANAKKRLEAVIRLELALVDHEFSRPFDQWWGTDGRTGVSSRWVSFNLANVIKEETEAFKPYGTSRDEQLAFLDKDLQELEAKQLAWMTEYQKGQQKLQKEEMDDLEPQQIHVKEAIAAKVDKEKKARAEFEAEVKKFRDEIATALAQAKKVITEAYDLAYDENKGNNDALVKAGTTRADFMQMAEKRLRSAGELWDREKTREAQFPGIAVMVTAEKGRYPIEITQPDCPFVYYVEEDQERNTIRLRKAEGDVELFAMKGRKSFRCNKEEAVIVAKQFQPLALKIDEKHFGANAAQEMMAENPHGQALYIRRDTLLQWTTVPDEKMTLGNVYTDSTPGFTLLLNDPRGAEIGEFGYRFFKGQKHLNSLPQLNRQPEIWAVE